MIPYFHWGNWLFSDEAGSGRGRNFPIQINFQASGGEVSDKLRQIDEKQEHSIIVWMIGVFQSVPRVFLEWSRESRT